jgi:hypothetical protein
VIANAKIDSYQSQFQLSARVYPDSRAGLTFHAVDADNLYIFWIDAVQGQVAVQRNFRGVVTILQAKMVPVSLDWHDLRVTMLGQQINATLDGALVISTADNTFATGSAGVYAQSTAFFDNLVYAITTNVCSGMTDGDSCSFVCEAGLISSGPITRTCSGTSGAATLLPDPVAAPLLCTLPKVVFVPTTVQVLENSPANTLVGNPLVAYSTSSQYQVLFSILTGSVPCASVSGQLVEKLGDLLLVAPPGCVFSSVVFASFGTPSLASPTPTTPYSLNPGCNAPTSVSIVSSLCVGKTACNVTSTWNFFGADPCSGLQKSLAVTMASTVITGNTDPTLFAINSCSGQISLRRGGKDVLDFEKQKFYTLVVKAFVAGFSPGSDNIQFITVAVLNVDEPPLVPSTVLQLPENGAALSATGPLIAWRPWPSALVGRTGGWDPENSTLTFTLSSDGSVGIFSVNQTDGSIVFANASRAPPLSFEATPNSFTLMVTATQKNDSSMAGTGTVRVVITDIDDPPVISRTQSLTTCTEVSGPGAQCGTVTAPDEDVGTFAGAANFTQLFGPEAVAACGSVLTSVTNPSTNGLTVTPATSLFSINATTGAVFVNALPATTWNLMSVFNANGAVARAQYFICVKATDPFGAFDAQPVPVVILANANNVPVVRNFTGATFMTTTGGEFVYFGGSGFIPTGAASTPTVTASYSNGVNTYTAAGCVVQSASQVRCTTVPGVGQGFTWSITGTSIVVGAYTSLVSLAASYLPPTLTTITGNLVSLATQGGDLITVRGTNFGPPGTPIAVSYGASG